MDLIIITGPQAVGKMTVGRELEKEIDAKLLYNHETIDLFARFLNYGKEAFRLSNQSRKELFKAFVNNDTNLVKGVIFTVVIAFDLEEDREFLNEINTIFLEAGGRVFLIELEADIETRLERNRAESRLEAKPSKRNLEFSKHELLSSYKKYRLNSFPNEVAEQFPSVHYLRINNTGLSAELTAARIAAFIRQQP